jgi:SAM-dependent methyltransferase
VSEIAGEAMEAEFDTVAGWTEQAVQGLGRRYAIPAGCRGSGSEDALAWLADRLRLRPGARVLDDGAGVGGPAGWLAERSGVRPVCADPMHHASRAAARLFGLPAVAALAQALPFPDGSFDAAWCLGVLCTTEEKAEALAELRRVLVPGARLGLLVFLADAPLTLPAPEGNSFPSEQETTHLLERAGYAIEDAGEGDLTESGEWRERADAVEAEIERRHGDDPRWQEAQEQSARIGRLLGEGQVRPWLAVAVAR